MDWELAIGEFGGHSFFFNETRAFAHFLILNYMFTLKNAHISSIIYNFWMQPNIAMKFAGHVAWMLLCTCDKFGEKIQEISTFPHWVTICFALYTYFLYFVCRCSTWNNFTSCIVSSGCTFDDIYQYRLSLGYWDSRSEEHYNASDTTYQFTCSHIEGNDVGLKCTHIGCVLTSAVE